MQASTAVKYEYMTDPAPGWMVYMTSESGPTFLKFLRKISGIFLILEQSLTISGKTLTGHNFALLTNIALLFPNLRLMLCSIFSYDFPKIRNLPKIIL